MDNLDILLNFVRFASVGWNYWFHTLVPISNIVFQAYADSAHIYLICSASPCTNTVFKYDSFWTEYAGSLVYVTI